LIIAIAVLACAAGPHLVEPIHDHFDILEVSSLHDDEGRPVFDQLIGWEYDSYLDRYVVQFWRLVKHKEMTHTSSPPSIVFFDPKKGGPLRRVTANTFVRSWSHVDPELESRNVLAQGMRRNLTKPYYAKPVGGNEWILPD